MGLIRREKESVDPVKRYDLGFETLGFVTSWKQHVTMNIDLNIFIYDTLRNDSDL